MVKKNKDKPPGGILMYKPTGGGLKPITEFKTFSGVEYQKRKEYFITIGGSWGGLQKFKPVFQRNNLFRIVTAYSHDSLLNLVTAFANEMYFFQISLHQKHGAS